MEKAAGWGAELLSQLISSRVPDLAAESQGWPEKGEEQPQSFMLQKDPILLPSSLPKGRIIMDHNCSMYLFTLLASFPAGHLWGTGRCLENCFPSHHPSPKKLLAVTRTALKLQSVIRPPPCMNGVPPRQKRSCHFPFTPPQAPLAGMRLRGFLPPLQPPSVAGFRASDSA